VLHYADDDAVVAVVSVAFAFSQRYPTMSDSFGVS
jgi:hypothetical protein